MSLERITVLNNMNISTFAKCLHFIEKINIKFVRVIVEAKFNSNFWNSADIRSVAWEWDEVKGHWLCNWLQTLMFFRTEEVWEKFVFLHIAKGSALLLEILGMYNSLNCYLKVMTNVLFLVSILGIFVLAQVTTLEVISGKRVLIIGCWNFIVDEKYPGW